MSLKIQVLHLRRSQLFHPGDQISGHVVAVGPLNDDNASIVVSFTGKAKVKFKIRSQKASYSDLHTYFSFSKVLFRGPCNVKEGSSITWPFKFKLPVSPPSSRLEANDSKQTQSWLDPVAQKEVPLPPSFYIEDAMGTGEGFSPKGRYKGSVTYKLCAELQRSKTLARTKRAKGGVPVTLCRTKAEIEEGDNGMKLATRLQIFDHSSSRLQAGREEQPRSLKQWTVDSFTKKAPRIVFQIAAHVPTYLIQGQSMPIQLVLKVVPGPTTAIPPLQFKFVTARFEFKASTQLSGTHFGSKQTMTPSDVVFTRNLEVEAAETVWKGVDETITIKRTLLPPNKSIAPSFTAKYIDRSYFVKLIVEVEIGGKRFEEKFRWSPVTVITKEVESPGGGDEIVAELDKEPSMTIEKGAEWGFEVLNGILEIVGDIFN